MCHSYKRKNSNPSNESKDCTNKYLLAGIAIEIILVLLIVYTPPLQRIFSTTPLNLNEWLFLLPFAVLLFADEFRKWVLRRNSRFIS